MNVFYIGTCTWCVHSVYRYPVIYYTLCIPNFLAVPLLDLVPPLLSVLRFTLSYSTTLSSGQNFTHPHTTATKQHAEQHHQNPILANQKFQFRNVKEMKLYHDWCWWFVCSWVPLAGLYNHKYASQFHADIASMMTSPHWSMDQPGHRTIFFSCRWDCPRLICHLIFENVDRQTNPSHVLRSVVRVILR